MAEDEGNIAMISLPQLVDLALNSPEVGIVNFTMLHAVLQVIVHQLNLEKCNIEFSGSDGERLQKFISSAKPGPMIKLTEYTLDADGKERKQRVKKKKSKRTVERKDENQKEKQINIIKNKESEGAKEETGSTESSDSFQTVILVEPALKEKESPKLAVALTRDQLNKITGDIKTLQEQVKTLTDLPSNLGLIEACRNSAGSTSPILDMFQILTLVKRLDATELIMNKMASMIEDLAKGQTTLAGVEKTEEEISKQTSDLEAIRSFRDQTEDLVQKSQELRKSLDGTVGGSNQIQDIINHLMELEKKMLRLEEKTKSLEEKAVQLESQSRRSSKRTSFGEAEITKKRKLRSEGSEPIDDMELGEAGDLVFEEVDLKTLPPQEAIAILQREILNMKEFNLANQAGVQALKEVEQLKEALMSDDDKSKTLPPDVKFGQMDIKISELKEQIGSMDTVFHQQFTNINDKIENLEKEISALWERISVGLPGGDALAAGSHQQIQDVYNKVRQLQEELNTLNEATNLLMSEKEGRETSFDMMNEQIELLKTVKADREDLEDALADKADACQINRKVSHEQFDAAYDEITKSLENTLEKLRSQEELWMQSLNDIQREIGNKLDKMELTPLKDFINSKLKGIQDRVKRISAMKQEHEAAGTKSKILRNVNCISCDADVVMKKTTDITMYPKPYAMPATKSPGPYLAYEMDQLRKQQKGLAFGKNLNILETALAGGKPGKLLDKDHLCNRYCGGSHTVTTPQQRVMRVGHFMEQWGPEIAPLNDVLIKGTDGHLYKGRDDVALRAAAAEKPPSPKNEAPIMTVSEVNTGGDKATFKGASQEVPKRPKTSFSEIPSEASKKHSVRSAELKKEIYNPNNN